jgi:hypothetical protein
MQSWRSLVGCTMFELRSAGGNEKPHENLNSDKVYCMALRRCALWPDAPNDMLSRSGGGLITAVQANGKNSQK